MPHRVCPLSAVRVRPLEVYGSKDRAALGATVHAAHGRRGLVGPGGSPVRSAPLRARAVARRVSVSPRANLKPANRNHILPGRPRPRSDRKYVGTTRRATPDGARAARSAAGHRYIIIYFVMMAKKWLFGLPRSGCGACRACGDAITIQCADSAYRIYRSRGAVGRPAPSHAP